MKQYEILDDTKPIVEEQLNTLSKEHELTIEGFNVTYGTAMTYFHIVVSYEVKDEIITDHSHAGVHQKAIDSVFKDIKPVKKKKVKKPKKTGTW